MSPITPANVQRYARYTQWPQLTEAGFYRGMVRDVPIWQIPKGGSYDLLDYLPDTAGILRKRGGSSYQGNLLNSHSDVDAIAVASPEFPGSSGLGDSRVLAFTSDSSNTWLYDATSGATSIGNVGFAPFENPPLYIDRMVITDGLGANAPKKAYLSAGVVTLGAWGGTPPIAKVSCLHAGYLVLANNPTHPNRIYFSNAIDAENAWDAAAYIDADGPVTGLASIGGVLIVFMRGHSQRILGDIPPGTSVTTDNMSIQPFAAAGCIDARSVVRMNDLVYFANEAGIYSTNGSSIDSITTKEDNTGIGSYWQSAMSAFSPALGAVVACGTYLEQYLFVSILHNSGAKTQLVYYAPQQAWARLGSTLNGVMYATRFAPSHELYVACQQSPQNRLRKLSGLFSPAAGNKNDAEGTAVTPIWQSRGLFETLNVQKYGHAHVSYLMTDAASDNPVLAIDFGLGLNPSSFEASPDTPLVETTAAKRKRFRVNKEAQSLTVKLTQSNASAATELYLLELEASPFAPQQDGTSG